MGGLHTPIMMGNKKKNGCHSTFLLVVCFLFPVPVLRNSSLWHTISAKHKHISNQATKQACMYMFILVFMKIYAGYARVYAPSSFYVLLLHANKSRLENQCTKCEHCAFAGRTNSRSNKRTNVQLNRNWMKKVLVLSVAEQKLHVFGN